jgi:hypothetical protein
MPLRKREPTVSPDGAAYGRPRPRSRLQPYPAPPRDQLARDDVLDAIACAVAARTTWSRTLSTLPARPEVDGHGLPMQMMLPSSPQAPVVEWTQAPGADRPVDPCHSQG